VAIPPVQAEGEEYWAYRYSQGRLAPHLQARLMGAYTPLAATCPAATFESGGAAACGL
jgi:hypothetical protein